MQYEGKAEEDARVVAAGDSVRARAVLADRSGQHAVNL